jgi:hypothetical protein
MGFFSPKYRIYREDRTDGSWAYVGATFDLGDAKESARWWADYQGCSARVVRHRDGRIVYVAPRGKR